jgi:hypothetical protein
MADKPTTVRIPAEIKSELEKIANKERRSLNAQIVVALTEHIESRKNK